MTEEEKFRAEQLERVWETDSRWRGVKRAYKPEAVLKLRGLARQENTLGYYLAKQFWDLINDRPFVPALGAMSGNQAVQYVAGGLEAIYMSGWQVAADANLDGQTYTDQSRYSVNSVPELVRRINNAFRLEESKEKLKGGTKRWFVPIVADAEAGFGGELNAFDLMRAMIQAGAAGVHFEDQLSSAKKCGHLGGKVLVPTSEFIRKLNAARLAADVMDTPTVLIARTDARDAHLITSDIDDRDKPFLTGERTSEGFYRMRGGMDAVIARALAYAPYADLLWFETSKPDLAEAKRFAEAIHAQYPGKLLAYNLSPSFNWKKTLDDETIAKFQEELGKMGYKFQFVTLAGFHALNLISFQMARGFAQRGMSAYVELQQEEFSEEPNGYAAARHQEFVGTEYADAVVQAVSGGESSTTAMEGSTEAEQFQK